LSSEHLLIRACKGGRLERVPVWAMRQAGRWDPEFRRLRGELDFYEFTHRSELAAAASLLPRRFGVDAIILFYDITTVPEAMGLKFEMVPDRGPVPLRPIRSVDDVDRLEARLEPDRYRFVLDTLDAVRSELRGELPVIAFAGAPFSVAAYCLGIGGDVPRLRQFIVECPEVWQKLADRLTEATIEFLNTLCQRGADVFQLFDTWAGQLSRAQYEQWAHRYHRRIFASCTMRPSILFVRECPHVELMGASGADVVSLGTCHNLRAAKAELANVSVQGNVDCKLLAYGTEAQVHEAVRQCLEAGGGHRHILTLNHGVLPDTPVQNFAAYVEAAREFRAEQAAS